jgi:hypothetical protein
MDGFDDEPLTSLEELFENDATARRIAHGMVIGQ